MPSVEVAAEINVGAVPATVELLVTEVLVKEAASSPSVSWMALLSLEPDGSL